MAIWNKRHAKAQWLVDLTLRNISDNSISMKYFSTGSVTVDGNDYIDKIDGDRAISLGYDALDTLGGIDSLKGQAEVNIINLDGESDILHTHILESMKIRLMSIEYSGNQFLVFFDGPIVSRGFDAKVWRITAEDNTETLFHTWPTRVIMLDDWPLAHLSILGHPYPINFGDMSKSPVIGGGNSARLAPCVPVEGGIFGRLHCGYGNQYGYELFELIDNRTWVLVIDKSKVEYGLLDTDNEEGVVTREILSSTRRRYSTIGPSAIGNTENNFRMLGDGRYDTYLEDVRELNVYLANEEDLGEIQSQKIVIKMKDPSPGDLTIELRKDGNRVGDFTAVPIYIGSYLQYEYTLADDKTWDLGQFTIYMETRKGANLSYIQVETDFVREDLSYQEYPNVWMPIRGIAYDDKNINGTATIGHFDLLQRTNNPVFQVLMILRGIDALNIPEQYINEESFLYAADKRIYWKFAFTVVRQQDKGQSLLANICKQSGLWLFWDKTGKISCKVKDKNVKPVRAFFLEHMIGDAGNFACDRTQRKNLFNYINLSFDLDRGRSIYNGSRVKSAVYRQSGTGGSIISSGGLFYFESSSTDGALLLSDTGNTEIYTLDGKRLRAIGSTTNSGRRVRVEFVSGSETASSSTDWWLGDTIDPDALRSLLLIGSIQSMGGSEPNFLDLGSFQSDLIIDNDTADLFLEHQAEWNFFPRSTVIFDTWWRAADLQHADCILVDHPTLPPDDRPKEVATLSSDISDSQTIIQMSSLSEFVLGDFLRIGNECLQYNEELSVSSGVFLRGSLGTEIDAHLNGDSVKKFYRKFFIKDMDYFPMSLDWRITAEAFPE